MSSFSSPRNRASSTLAGPRSVGGTSLVLASGTGALFGSAFPVRVGCVRASDSAFVILQATGRTGDTLTGVAVLGSGEDATADIALAAGDSVAVLITAGMLAEVHAAILAAESDIAGKASVSHTHALDGLSDVAITSPSSGQVLKYDGAAWVNGADSTGGGGGGSGTVTSVSVVAANGLGGTVADAATTPAITLTTSVSGMVKGDGTAFSAAVAGTDYLTPNGNGSGLTSLTPANISSGTAAISVTGNAATVTNGVYTSGAGTVFLAPNGNGGNLTNLTPANIAAGTAGISITGNAATVTNGVYTTGDQTIGGTKTFSSAIAGSITGNAATVTNGVYTTGAGTVFLAPNGSGANLTNLTAANISAGTAGISVTGTAANVTGTVAVANGGTGLTTVMANRLVKGNGAGAMTVSGVSLGTNDEIDGFRGSHNRQTGTTYTLQSSDTGKVLFLNNASAITLTLPNSLLEGFNCVVVQEGAGQVTFTPASGATLNNRSGYTKTAGQYSPVSLLVRSNAGGAAAAYLLMGDGA